MTREDRERIRAEVDRRQRARLGKKRMRRRPIDAAVYARVLSACCPESTVDVRAHARRVALRVAQVKAAA